MTAFSENLKKWRTLRGYSRREMASLLDMTVSSYAHYENGHTQPAVDKLLLIAKKLQVSADELLGFQLDEFMRCKNFWGSIGYRVEETSFGRIDIVFDPHLEHVRIKDGRMEIEEYSMLASSDRNEFIELTHYAKEWVEKAMCGIRKKIIDQIVNDSKCEWRTILRPVSE